MKIRSFNVQPNLPENMSFLKELVDNMWFAWNWQSVELFNSMDSKLWVKARRNPKWFLGSISQKRLEELSNDADFIGRVNAVKAAFENYKNRTAWYQDNKKTGDNFLTAYFSMEFGIGEGLPIYSGGLGMLAGDHIKSASDLGMPIIGIGLFYRHGYVQQQLNKDGWQNEAYPDNDWANMAVERVLNADGSPLKVDIQLGADTVFVAVWKVPVGRTCLYLLDTNLPENKPEYRTVTDALYGGDRENRIRQEVVLGIGGIKALEAMNIKPTVYHINEGHAAFLLFQRIIDLQQKEKMSYQEAWETVWATSVFTTHTPVIAGNEYFDPMLVKKYMEFYAGQMGISWDEFLAIGKETPAAPQFCMTVVALRLAAYLNGVSVLHGKVSQEMWRNVWPGLPLCEVPITAITNGVHLQSWTSHEHVELYNKYCFDWDFHNGDITSVEKWSKIENVPDLELWNVHLNRKIKMVEAVRRRVKNQLTRQGADTTAINKSSKILKPEVLTIGFARRFATYKRATLLFKDLDRLEKIVNNEKYPVQFVFAGKAHPADTAGKEFIKYIYAVQNEPRFKGKVVFVEDYNMNLARYLVQGVDVWLNNPIRPLEASGTSGMKTAANGALTLSVLDGWWDEVGPCDFSWSVGGIDTYKTDEERDAVEAETIYNMIESEIAPLFYERNEDDLPAKWVRNMKQSIKAIAPFFNTHRMVQEYYHKFYVNAHNYGQNLLNDGVLAGLSQWRKRIEDNWFRVSVTDITPVKIDEIKMGDSVTFKASVTLGSLTPDDVSVEVYMGTSGTGGEIMDSRTIVMTNTGREGDNYIYEVSYSPENSGRKDYALRVMPKNDAIVSPLTPLFLRWE